MLLTALYLPSEANANHIARGKETYEKWLSTQTLTLGNDAARGASGGRTACSPALSALRAVAC